MIIIIAEEGKKIHLGRVGENEARAVRFDISRIQAEFPGATFSVLNMRPEDPDAYPVNGQYIRIEGNYLYWTLQSGDLTQDALGECELKATLDGVIVKSIIWTTEICPALDGNGTPPEPWESWVEQVEEAAEDSEAWAVGERGGVPVVDGDPTYENNAKYYAEEAAETLASKADKTDTVLNTTLSRGRKSTTAKGTASIAFGTDVTASGANSTAVGSNTKATGSYSSASGLATEATGSSSHAEGNNTRADGQGSHAEGYNTSASGQYSHSENEYTTARGAYSHAEGSHTTASHKSQHVFGEYNEEDNPSGSASSRGAFIEIVGNGTAYNAKSNARTLDWNGNERLKGDLYVGANADGTGGTKVAKITDIPEPVDVRGKADKVSDAVSGNFAGLDAEGNLTDSGKAASDFVAAENFRADAMPMSETDPTTVAEKATELKSQIDGKADLIHDTVSNVAIASVPDGAANLPLTDLKFRVEPIQSGSGDPSPTNVRPITGRTSAVVSQSGADTSDPTTHTVQFGQTVYGCLADYVNGKAYVTHAIVTVDNNTSFDMANTAFYAEDVFPENEDATLATGNFICNKYICEDSIGNSQQIASRSDMSFFNQTSRQSYRRRLFVKDSRFSTAAAFQASLETEPIVIVYPLPTPIEIPLSDLDEISTVEGQNNVWADCGDIVELTYGCDTRGYVDRKISASQTLMELIVTANREDGMKASKAYSSGNLLIVNGTLYRATTSIANGATLTVGTNVTATTVAAELAALA